MSNSMCISDGFSKFIEALNLTSEMKKMLFWSYLGIWPFVSVDRSFSPNADFIPQKLVPLSRQRSCCLYRYSQGVHFPIR